MFESYNLPIGLRKWFVDKLLEQLKAEYLLRVSYDMKLVFANIDFQKMNFEDYDFVLTIINNENKTQNEIYSKCKKNVII